jgi:hypothetical protein
MQSPLLDTPDRAGFPLQGPLLRASTAVTDASHDNAYLLQRTQDLVNNQPADSRYWTAYDLFMLEREARALRRAYLSALFARAGRGLFEGLSRLRSR